MICQTRTTLLLIVGGLSAGLAALAAPPASGATDCAGFIQPLGRAGSFWRQAGAERVQVCIAQLGTAARSKRRQLTPLHLAALFSGNPAVHSALLNAGADPNAKAKGGFAPLHLAAQSGRSPAVVATLLDAGADPDARTDKGFTPLHLAVENNRTPEVVVALLQGGADPDTRNKQGATPLILAVRYDRNPTIVAALLQGGADPNLRTEKGFSPLHLAAQYSRQTGIVAELLKGGADPNSWIRGGFTPLHIAAQHNRNPAIAAELLKGGARPDAKTGKGASPLHLAAMFSRNPAVVATLIKGGADPNAKIKAGATPLHLAAYRNGNPAIVTALLDAGADPTMTYKGQTAFDLGKNNKKLADSAAYRQLKQAHDASKAERQAARQKADAKSEPTRKEKKISAEGGHFKTGANSTEMKFRRIRFGNTEIRNIVCKIQATLKCAGTANGKKAACESSKLSQSEVKKMGLAAALMLPTMGPGLVAACFAK